MRCLIQGAGDREGMSQRARVGSASAGILLERMLEPGSTHHFQGTPPTDYHLGQLLTEQCLQEAHARWTQALDMCWVNHYALTSWALERIPGRPAMTCCIGQLLAAVCVEEPCWLHYCLATCARALEGAWPRSRRALRGVEASSVEDSSAAPRQRRACATATACCGGWLGARSQPQARLAVWR